MGKGREKAERALALGRRKWGLFLVWSTQFLLLCCVVTGNPVCVWDEVLGQLNCSNIHLNTTSSLSSNNLTHVLLTFAPEHIWRVESIQIDSSGIPVLGLQDFVVFPSLRNLSVQRAEVKNLTGPVPQGLRSLDLSHNHLTHIHLSTFPTGPHTLTHLDLSYNNLSALPNNTFSLQLKRLNVIQNPFRCKWVIGSSFANWYSRRENHDVFQNFEQAICKADVKAFGNMSFQSAVDIRQKGLEECNKTPCECDLFTTIGNGKFPSKDFPVLSEQVSFTLRADCSHKNLTELPTISRFTVLLAMEGNQIWDLSPLALHPDYANLHTLNLNQNQVQDIAPLVNSSFFQRVQNIQLKHNHIYQLTDQVIEAMFVNNNAQRINNIALGNNMINCDCDTVTKLKPKLVEHENIIKDWKTISCRSPLVSLLDLRYDQVCHVETEQSELQWYILIGVEVFLILLVLFKVWLDRRDYRRTGVLPKYSACIPRLPCDYSLKAGQDSHLDPKHHHVSAAKV